MFHIPISIEAWTKDYVRRGVVARPESVSGMIAHNGPGAFEFTVPSDHPRVPDLSADGARAVILYRPEPGADPETLISGQLTDVSGKGASLAAIRTYRLKDDWTVLNEILGLPNPTGTMTQQGADTAYFTRTGPAEDVVTQIVAPNATRQGVNLTVPASLGRGASCEVSVRMHPLSDRLFPTIDQAGIGVRIVQRGSDRVLEVYEPTTRSRVLTETSGVVTDGDWTLTMPTVTRVIVGAGGEGTARVFREYVDAALETRFGVSRAVFVDARDVDPADPNLTTILQARADEALAEGAPKTSVSATLTETRAFRYGRSYRLGDRISLRLAGSPVLSDLVREVSFSYTADGGLEIVPKVGAWSESATDDLYRKVATLARAARDAQRR